MNLEYLSSYNPRRFQEDIQRETITMNLDYLSCYQGRVLKTCKASNAFLTILK